MKSFSIVLALSTVGSLAYADTIHNVDITTSDEDNTLIESSTGALSNGSGDIYVGRTAQPSGTSIRRGMIHFDIASASIPSNATITDVSLEMFLERCNNIDQITRTLLIYAASSSWGEGTSYQNGGMGSASTTNDATWIHRFYSTTSWSTPGGDHSSTASGSGQMSFTDFATDLFTGAGMASDVQAWLASPSANHGWEMIGAESTGQTARRYTSRNDADDLADGGYPPILHITYTTP